MTDHGQLDQDPQIVAFSPELLKLADRRRQALEYPPSSVLALAS